MDPIIELENVAVVYDEGKARETVALQDISLKIYPREYIILFGPSGCGKSTLLNVIAGLEQITTGKIMVGGRNLAEMDDEESSVYHRHQLGFVFQAYNLISTLTVLENIALPQMLDGRPRREWARSAAEFAERFGIQEQVKKLPQELSGGQQQRVGIARALVNNPAILIADEPTGNLDSKNTRMVLDIFQELNLKEKKTMILVTHSPEYLSEADRIFFLKDGKIFQEVRNKERILCKAQEHKEETPIVLQAKKEKEEEKKKEEETKKEEAEKASSVSELITKIRLPHRGFIGEQMVEFMMDIHEDSFRRMERIVEDHVRGNIGAHEMMMSLDKPYAEGGAGLNSKTAARVSHMTEHMIASAEMLKRYERRKSEEKGSIFRLMIKGVEEGLGIHLEAWQEERLKALFEARMKNRLTPPALRSIFQMSKANQGLALRPTTARKLSWYLELLLLVKEEVRAHYAKPRVVL